MVKACKWTSSLFIEVSFMTVTQYQRKSVGSRFRWEERARESEREREREKERIAITREVLGIGQNLRLYSETRMAK